MKILIALILLSVTTLSFADSLNCTFTKNFDKITVVETFDEIDEEECSENYFGKVGDVQADVLYLPYQEGIYLSITDMATGVEASATDHESSEVSLTIGNDTYTLHCAEIE